MSKTLTYTDSINRIGYTTIDGALVVQYNCTIQTDAPENIDISSVKIDPDLYKKNREICRADMAEFEDMAYQLQDQYIEKQGKQEKESK